LPARARKLSFAVQLADECGLKVPPLEATINALRCRDAEKRGPGPLRGRRLKRTNALSRKTFVYLQQIARARYYVSADEG
jgi:hypothetical protein